MSQKFLQCFGGFFRTLLQQPVSSIFQHHNGHIRSDELHLLCECISQCLLTANHQHRHGQFSLRELGEILCGLLEGDEVSPAGAHASGGE